jgi:hypothetical protein
MMLGKSLPDFDKKVLHAKQVLENPLKFYLMEKVQEMVWLPFLCI